jgi:hypothetical protein
MTIEELKQHIQAANGQGFAIADLPQDKIEEILPSLPQLWKDIEATGSLL